MDITVITRNQRDQDYAQEKTKHQNKTKNKQ